MDHPPVFVSFAIILATSWYAAKKIKNGWWLLLVVPVFCALAVGVAFLLDTALRWESWEKAVDTAIVNSMIAVFVGTVAAARVRLRMLVARLRVNRLLKKAGTRDIIVLPKTVLRRQRP